MLGLDINSNWEGSYFIKLATIIGNTERCSKKYLILKGNPPLEATPDLPEPGGTPGEEFDNGGGHELTHHHYRYLDGMPEFNDKFF